MSLNTAYHAPINLKPRHVSDIEAEIDGLREYARQHPFMKVYADAQREALRLELRAARKASYVAPARSNFFRRMFGALIAVR